MLTGARAHGGTLLLSVNETPVVRESHRQRIIHPCNFCAPNFFFSNYADNIKQW